MTLHPLAGHVGIVHQARVFIFHVLGLLFFLFFFFFFFFLKVLLWRQEYKLKINDPKLLRK